MNKILTYSITQYSISRFIVLVGFDSNTSRFLEKHVKLRYKDWRFCVLRGLDGRYPVYTAGYVRESIKEVCRYILNRCSDDSGKITTPSHLFVLYVPHEGSDVLLNEFFPFAKCIPVDSDDSSSWFKVDDFARKAVFAALKKLVFPNPFPKIDHRKLPLRNFQLEGRTDCLWQFFMNKNCPLTASFPGLAVCRAKNCFFSRNPSAKKAYYDDRGYYFFRARPDESHGFPRICSLSNASYEDICCFMQSAYRFGLALEPDLHYDVMKCGGQDIKSSFYCCRSSEGKEVRASYVNIYPNDTIRE